MRWVINYSQINTSYGFLREQLQLPGFFFLEKINMEKIMNPNYKLYINCITWIMQFRHLVVIADFRILIK